MSKPLLFNDFYSAHSPFGAYASFYLGRQGQGGGFGSGARIPDSQDVYIALIRPGQETVALPFMRDEVAQPGTPRLFAPSEITRTLKVASDTWVAGDLTFALYTPFGAVPDMIEIGDGEMRQHLCPVVYAEITIDNRTSTEESHAFFGISATSPLRALSDTDPGLCGIARSAEYGFAVVPSVDGIAVEILTEDLWNTLSDCGTIRRTPLDRSANRGGVLLAVRPGEKRTYTLALGFYRDGTITSGIATSFLYTRLFSDLEAALAYGVEHAVEAIEKATFRDTEWAETPVSDDRHFLLTQAIRSYLASSMLLHDLRGAVPRSPFAAATTLHRPIWVVNDGETQRMNCFDVTVDQAFYELLYHPWTLRSTLDLFIHRYSYTDEVMDATDPERSRFPGGVSFARDMGIAGQFSPPGHSASECPDQIGKSSYLTQEELCNFCLCAALYGLPTVLSDGDVLWLATHRMLLHRCLQSLLHRDGPRLLQNGLMSLDSARCGNGQEAVAYDSLPAPLSQARGNAYLAVKTWAAFLALSRCFDTLGEEDWAVEAEECAACAAATIARQWQETQELLPAIFNQDSASDTVYALPVIEGLVYPFLWQDEDAVSPFGRYGQLISQLRRHLKAALTSGVCLDQVSGGIRLFSTSETTWIGKTFLAQFIAEDVLGFVISPAVDSVHARWLREKGGADTGFVDEIRATDGQGLGARFSPRGVAGILWML